MSGGDSETLTAAPHGAEETLGPGKHLGRYAIERELGRGGMGVVYAAHDPDLDRAVALKLLRGPGDDFARARLLREARAMAKLSHPNVITVYEVDTVGDVDFVAMELVDGSSVDRWLESPRGLPEILDVFMRAGRGLAAAHDKGLVHRDFKPHNVLVGRDGKVVVTDFGLARAAEPVGAPAAAAETAAAGVAAAETPALIRGDEETIAPPAGGVTPASKPSWSTTLTQTGALLGTPAYMAPEQWEGATAEPRTDQFAFCVSVWEAVSGERPFRGENLAQLRKAAAAGPPPAPKGLPAWLAPILRRGLAVAPAARWPSMTAVVDAIEHGRGRGRRRVIATGVVAALLVGGGAAAIALGRGDGASTRVSAGAASMGSPAPAAGGDSVCQPVDAAAAELWTADRRRGHHERLASAPGIAAFTDRYFSQLTERWRETYQRVCGDRGDRQRLARVACLEGWRDSTVVGLDAFAQLPVQTWPHVPYATIVPGFEPCLGPSPVLPPAAPPPEQRDAVRRLRSEAAVLAFSLTPHDDPQWAPLHARAAELDYRPAIIELGLIRASMRESAEDYAGARADFETLASEAEAAGAVSMRADALIGVASTLIAEGASEDAIVTALRSARNATSAAGAPLMQRLVLDQIDAERRFDKGDRDAGIAEMARVASAYVEASATGRAAWATILLAHMLDKRDGPGDHERAIAVLTEEAARERAELGEQAVNVADLDAARAELEARRRRPR